MRSCISSFVDSTISIPTPYTGCDGAVRATHLFASVFQSPHPSRGAIGATRYSSSSQEVSIPTPLTGCDTFDFCSGDVVTVSIPTPLTGCDFRKIYQLVRIMVSIPTPLTGCDSKMPQYRKAQFMHLVQVAGVLHKYRTFLLSDIKCF